MNAMGNIRDSNNDRTMVERIDPLMGTVIEGHYRIDFRLASGGFGAIYRATHLTTGEQYALKILHGELATSDARVILRFRREAETLAQLKNPNTIQAYGHGEAPDGSLYIVMELLDGESLYEQFRAKGPLPWERVVRIGRQICNSLAEAHALGIVHRDLKPANIHLETKDGTPDFVKVLDFGIAKLTGETSGVDSTELTQAGQMIGTFDYMAPEQMVGGQCTGKTDIYTLGVVLYEMICGRRPFADAASPTAMLAALLTQLPPPLGVRGVPGELERILRRCLEREPQHRYDDVGELAADLDRLLASLQEGVTRKLHTPPPVIVDAEATVVAQPRAKRGTPPHPAVTVDQRPRRGSEPPPVERAKRDSSPPNPNVIRREGSAPVIPNPSAEARARRDSQPAVNVVRRDSQPVPLAKKERDSQPVLLVKKDRDSQPVPLARREDPGAWQSLQIPKRDPGRESQPAARYDGRDSQNVPVYRDNREGSQPVKVPEQPAYGAYPQYPGYPNQTPAPQIQPPAPIQPPPHMATPVHHVAPQPIPPTPSPDPRVALAVVDPNAWRNQTPSRGSILEPRGYDMAASHSRDVMVRRVVWAMALVLGVILVLVVASRL